MCRTLTALGVLYHNYRIVITPPPSQEGLYRMHGRGMQGKVVEVEGGRGEGTGSDGGVGISAVQLATTAVLYRHFKGNREYHFDISFNTHNTVFQHTVVPSPFS